MRWVPERPNDAVRKWPHQTKNLRTSHQSVNSALELTHATLHQPFVLVWQVKLEVCPRWQRKVGLNYMPVWTQSMFKYTVKRLLHINRCKALKALYWMDRSKLTWDDPTVLVEAKHHGSGLLFNLKLQSTECKWDQRKAEINVLSTSLVWKVWVYSWWGCRLSCRPHCTIDPLGINV